MLQRLRHHTKIDLLVRYCVLLRANLIISQHPGTPPPLLPPRWDRKTCRSLKTWFSACIVCNYCLKLLLCRRFKQAHALHMCSHCHIWNWFWKIGVFRKHVFCLMYSKKVLTFSMQSRLFVFRMQFFRSFSEVLALSKLWSGSCSAHKRLAVRERLVNASSWEVHRTTHIRGWPWGC